jgi:hypothetical protein
MVWSGDFVVAVVIYILDRDIIINCSQLSIDIVKNRRVCWHIFAFIKKKRKKVYVGKLN